MSSLNTFLKVLQKVGYPNPSVTTYAKVADYDLNNLFNELIDEVGYEKADSFVWNAIQAISNDGKGIRVNLDKINATGAYAYLTVVQSRIDLEESDNSALISWSWGENKIANVDEDGNDDWKTIEEMWEEVDMGDWGDFDNFIDEIKDEVNEVVYQNCGFYLWFDNEV
jgi:hypothetical protein